MLLVPSIVIVFGSRKALLIHVEITNPFKIDAHGRTVTQKPVSFPVIKLEVPEASPVLAYFVSVDLSNNFSGL